jgi:hypothetical protein
MSEVSAKQRKLTVLVAAFAQYAGLPVDRDRPEFAAMLRDLPKHNASLEFTVETDKGHLAEWYLRDRETGNLLARAIFRPDGSTEVCDLTC